VTPSLSGQLSVISCQFLSPVQLRSIACLQLKFGLPRSWSALAKYDARIAAHGVSLENWFDAPEELVSIWSVEEKRGRAFADFIPIKFADVAVVHYFIQFVLKCPEFVWQWVCVEKHEDALFR